MTGVPLPYSLPRPLSPSDLKGPDIVASFSSPVERGNPRGLSLCAGAEADWNVCPGPCLLSPWIDAGRTPSVLCLSDCEEANKPKMFHPHLTPVNHFPCWMKSLSNQLRKHTLQTCSLCAECSHRYRLQLSHRPLVHVSMCSVLRLNIDLEKCHFD